MAEASTRLSWVDLLRAMARWLVENLPRALLMSAFSFAFGWLVNFWFMAFRWDGFRAPTGESDYIAAENSLVTGTLFWMALSTFLFAVVSYGFRVGWSQLFQELFGLPGRIGRMFGDEERNRTLTTLLWAVMLSLLLSLVVSPGIAAIVAGFFLAFAATPLGELLASVLRRLWIQLVARFAPHKGEPSSQLGSAAVTGLGLVVGCLVAVAIDFWPAQVLALLLAGAAAYYFANEDELSPGGGAAVFLLLAAAAVVIHELLEVGVAFADDGGWSECGDCNVIDYVTSTGATEVVSRSTVAGGGAAVGAPVGSAVGDIIGSIGGGGGGGTGGGGGGGGTGGGLDGGGGTGGGLGGGGGGGDLGGVTTAPSDGATAPTQSAAAPGGGAEAPTEGATSPGDGTDAGVRTASDETITRAPDADTAPVTDASSQQGPTAGGGADEAERPADGDILGAIGGGEGGNAAAGQSGPTAGGEAVDEAAGAAAGAGAGSLIGGGRQGSGSGKAKKGTADDAPSAGDDAGAEEPPPERPDEG